MKFFWTAILQNTHKRLLPFLLFKTLHNHTLLHCLTSQDYLKTVASLENEKFEKLKSSIFWNTHFKLHTINIVFEGSSSGKNRTKRSVLFHSHKKRKDVSYDYGCSKETTLIEIQKWSRLRRSNSKISHTKTVKTLISF